MAQPYRKNTVYGSLAYDLDALVRERQLEDAQLAYCRLAGIDVGKRGIGYIPWYREEYRNLAHVKVEEAQQKLQEQIILEAEQFLEQARKPMQNRWNFLYFRKSVRV